MQALGNNVIVEPTPTSDSGLIMNTSYSVLSIGSLVPTQINVGARVLIADDKLQTIGITTYCNYLDIIAVI
tara:strand:+ start:2544 stop:2756 length:213 start_codon:yes stop_codon:yes gene_type:complete